MLAKPQGRLDLVLERLQPQLLQPGHEFIAQQMRGYVQQRVTTP